VQAILVNPWIKTVSKVEIDKKDINTVYRALTWLHRTVHTVQIGGSFPNGDNILCEAPQDKVEAPRFMIGTRVVNGCGLFLGVDADTAWHEPMFMLTEIQDYVRFMK